MFCISHHLANIKNLHSQTENELTDQEISIEKKNGKKEMAAKKWREWAHVSNLFALCPSLRVLFQWNCCWPTVHLLTHFHFKKLCTTFAVQQCSVRPFGVSVRLCFLLLPFCFNCLFSWPNLFNYMAFWFFILSLRCFRFFVRKMLKMILNQQHTKYHIFIDGPFGEGGGPWIESPLLTKETKEKNFFFFILLRNELNHLFYWMQSMLTLFGVIPTNC